MGGYAPGIVPASGGAYASHDGGATWSIEGDLGIPLEVCATADYHLFCAGTDESATSHLFERDFDHIRVNSFE